MKIANKIVIIIWFTLLGFNLSAQNGIILRGTVKDKTTSEPIIGATIIEYDKDKRIITGSISDMNGNYVLSAHSKDAIIMFSFIGYVTFETPLNGISRLDVELELDSYNMEEVTVTAKVYNDPLTGLAERNMATSRVKVDLSEYMQDISISAEEALVGKITGLDITSFSGDPGSGSSIVIRGLGSLGNASPLIVVDGIPQSTASSGFDFSSADQEDIGELVNIAPQDIKSIEVLKDAGSTAQWGSKGADGVLQIETFRGTKGRTKFNYQNKFTWNFQPPSIPMLNGDEYIMLQLEEWHNSSGIYEVPSEIAYDIDYIDFYNYNKNIDWIRAVSQNSYLSENFFKLSGGGEKTRYYASMSKHKSTGTTINTGLERLSTRVNLDYDVSKKLRFSVNFSYTDSDVENNYIVGGTNIREMAYRKAPNMSIYEYDFDGRPTGEYFNPINSYQGSGTQYFNPVAVGDLSTNDISEKRIKNDFTLHYNILPWLRFQEIVSFQYLNQKKKQFLPADAIGADWLNSLINQSSEDNYSKAQIITRSQLFFLPRINSNHVFSAIAMFETDQQGDEWSMLSGRNGPSTSLQDPAANTTLNNINSGHQEIHILGILASANYVMMDRYGIGLNYRRDASSRFGKNYRWGSFPSFGIFWRFTNEPWMEKCKFISQGKVNYSYGMAGKQPGGAYDRHAIINEPTNGGANQYINDPIVVQQQVQLSNLKWQTVYSHNLKLDLGFFKDRLMFTGEVYKKITEDLLWRNYMIPKSSGYTSLKWFNGGSLENKGWEIVVSLNALKRKNTSLNFNFNISQNINSFIEFPENFNPERDQNIGNGQFPRRAIVGQPIGSFYGFRYQGVWASDEDVYATDQNGEPLIDVNGNHIPVSYMNTYNFQGGDAKYEDINHDGKIDIMDAVYLGDSNPDFIGGFGATLNWKDFRVATQWHYRTGFQIVNEIAMNTQGMLGKDNQSVAVLHRWRSQGQNEENMLPRAYYGHPANNLGSDRYVENGDFLRLLNLSFSYKVPKSLCAKMKVSSLNFGLSMRRILTFTGYSGQDPEIPQKIEDPFWFGTDRARTPPPQSYSINVTLGF
ncbi:MAG: SusC/RagA family TonB-linked outer membrane protein [Bacteroidales bacterium]|nr:SusC/RagA family TonB-linked outer membrane protein [Bacteroidales bacterium]